MKIALVQINPTIGDFAGNKRLIVQGAEAAAARGADLAVFPELATCGYPPADLLEKRSFVSQAEQVIGELAAWTAVPGRPALLCGTVLPTELLEGKRVRNAAVLLAAGETVQVQAKMLLPFYDVFDEQRYFEPAEAQALTSINGQQLAVTICEDAWNDKEFWPRRRYAVDPVEQLMAKWTGSSVKIILNLSASPFWQGKRETRREMLSSLAARHGAFVAMVNQVGGNDSLIFDGSSVAFAPDGSVVAQAASFREDLVMFDTEDAAPLDLHDSSDVAAMHDALVLGVRDYVRKCGFSKALVGLSGGIDSAVVAAIAVEALGSANVLGVGMPSEYSSAGSRSDAQVLAQNLGIRFEILPIHPTFHSYLETLHPLFEGTSFGLAEENLQSRIRGGLLMALSNKFGALVLTTGNKSEMSTGYCTLYGDMVGALAVIGDVMKTKVYELSRHINREREIIPRSTMEKAPSAELRPEQKDTDSLPAYEVLDPILQAYVERYCSAEEIAVSQNVDFGMVQQVVELVERSEYKRQQAAPVLKVTEKSFGSGRRFPIAVKM